MSAQDHTTGVRGTTDVRLNNTHAARLPAWYIARIHNLAARVTAVTSGPDVETVENSRQDTQATVSKYEEENDQARAPRRTATAEKWRSRRWWQIHHVQEIRMHEVEIAKSHLANRKEREAYEKRERNILTGIAYGFHPTAGVVAPDSPAAKSTTEGGGCFVNSGRVSRSRMSHLHERDEAGLKTGRRWEDGTAWGIEFGGPGQEGQYGYGSLKLKRKGKGKRVATTNWSHKGSRRSSWSRRL